MEKSSGLLNCPFWCPQLLKHVYCVTVGGVHLNRGIDINCTLGPRVLTLRKE